MPKFDNSLVGKCLDIFEKYTLVLRTLTLTITELRWNQGNIIKIGSITACHQKSEAVMICWDINPDGIEESTNCTQRLITSKRN